MKTFLDYRRRSMLKQALLLRDLSRICRSLALTPISGDTCDRAAWDAARAVFPTRQPHYVPDHKEGAVLLRGPAGPVAILSIHDDGYYGQTLVGGNHDLRPFELKGLLEQSLRAPRERNPYTPGAVCGTAG